MKQWTVGWNTPGSLPDEPPIKVESWVEARAALALEVGHHFEAKINSDENVGREDMFAYTRASGIMRGMRADEPFSMFYDGWVWWLADV